IMAQKKFRITQKDFLTANRRAARLEEIEAHGRPVQMRTMTHRSKKVYDRKRFKRAAIKNDDSFFVPIEGEIQEKSVPSRMLWQTVILSIM
ncbi:MAG: hypothetical protein IJU13_01490, partial [Bacteroidales bacterium]|nr:hypothetical protein [Bacteroidales bacterium]